MKRTNAKRLDKFVAYSADKIPGVAAHLAEQELEQALRDRMEDLAIDLLGPPNAGGPHDMRWGQKGMQSSLSVNAITAKFNERNLGERKHPRHPLSGGPFQLIQFVNDCTFSEAVALGKKWLDANPNLAPRVFSVAEVRAHSQSEAKKRNIALKMIWMDAKGADGTIGETYLCDVRRLERSVLDHPDIRYDYKCQHRDAKGNTTRNPALILLYRDIFTDEPRGIERIYLSSNGRNKANLNPNRAMLGGDMHDSVFKVTPHAKVTKHLGICEGAIDALSLAQSWLPVWATGGDSKLSTFPILKGVEKLIIFADNDKAGLAAAEACAERWRRAGREVAIAPPPDDAKDWNDVLRKVKGGQ